MVVGWCGGGLAVPTASLSTALPGILSIAILVPRVAEVPKVVLGVGGVVVGVCDNDPEPLALSVASIAFAVYIVICSTRVCEKHR